MPTNRFFCATNSPEHKDSSFTVINDNEQQLMPTFNKLEPENNKN